jgi:hypothetical protein
MAVARADQATSPIKAALKNSCSPFRCQFLWFLTFAAGVEAK